MASTPGLCAARIVAAARCALSDRPVNALSIAIVHDEQMSELHERYMGDDSPTDVLTFDLRDDRRSPEIEGEIVVSADTARREAARRKLGADQELLRYVVHGVLHLLGMNDHTAAGRQQMRRAETRILNRLESPRARQ